MIKLMHNDSHVIIVVFAVNHLASFIALYVGKEAFYVDNLTHSSLPQNFLYAARANKT